MEIYKQFSFVGNFRKKHEEDENQIERIIANIFCNKNGSVFLEIGPIQI
jgi:hypothetical protein